MGYNGKLFLVGVVSLIIGAACGIAYGMMKVDEVTTQLNAVTQEKNMAVQNAQRMSRMGEDALKKYSGDLAKVVMATPSVVPAPAAPAAAAPEAPEGPASAPAAPADDSAKLVDSARAILAMRDSYRGTLDQVRGSLDSDFDALATELGNTPPNTDNLKQLLDNLKQNWPSKEQTIADAMRRLLSGMGLVAAIAPASGTPTAAAAAKSPAPAAAK